MTSTVEMAAAQSGRQHAIAYPCPPPAQRSLAVEGRARCAREAQRQGEPLPLTAEALLSWYAKAVHKVCDVATPHTLETSEQPLLAVTLPRGKEWELGTGAEAERLFSRMSHADLVSFCCQVHWLLSGVPQNDCGGSVVSPLHAAGEEAAGNAYCAPLLEGAPHRQESEEEELKLRQRLPAATMGGTHPTAGKTTVDGDKSASLVPPPRSRRYSVPRSPAEQVSTTRYLHKEDWFGGAKILNEYVVLKNIGKGTSGKVKLAYSFSRQETVAIKIIHRPKVRDNQLAFYKDASAKQAEALQREIEVMKRLQHENIVTLYEVIDDPAAEKLYLVMQYIDNGTIAVVGPDGRCPKMAPETLLLYARQILAGLEYLHDCNVVHRDIKPENILIDKKNSAFLADFGVAAFLEQGAEDVLNRFEGTPSFMPPEMFSLKGEAEDASHSADEGARGSPFALDVWSLGVAFYTLLVGRVPFLSVEAIEAVRRAPVVIADEVPEAWRQLLQSMLSADPRQRPHVSAVRSEVERMARTAVTRQQEDVSPILAGCDVGDALTPPATNTGNVCSIASPMCASGQTSSFFCLVS
ncbi:protein kinase [Trypanosoma conorhini]|uniref:Protein kinase n=1 Tax=Trypanosoma conorhini TaxID=83891 RepID=A0A422Q7C3_9TRYP|nr:protein kinase [Trypanosoma conorhini]RNF25860.1 protein kinase [Trypanosoma conorhini]